MFVGRKGSGNWKVLHSGRLRPYSQTFTRLQMPDRNKWYSLLCPFVSYEENELLWTRPQKHIKSCNLLCLSVHLSILLTVCLSFCTSISSSVHFYGWRFVCPSVCHSISLCSSVHLPVVLSVCLFLLLSICFIVLSRLTFIFLFLW
jgi:hypothetical protein